MDMESNHLQDRVRCLEPAPRESMTPTPQHPTPPEITVSPCSPPPFLGAVEVCRTRVVDGLLSVEAGSLKTLAKELWNCAGERSGRRDLSLRRCVDVFSLYGAERGRCLWKVVSHFGFPGTQDVVNEHSIGAL